MLLTFGKHACIISSRGDVWAYKTILTPPVFIEMSMPSQEKKVVMYLCVRGIDITSFCDSGIGFWNCSDSVAFVLFFVFMLYLNL